MPLRFSIRDGDGAYVRTADVYIPPDWYDYVPIPVVLVFHGGGMTAATIAEATRFHQVSEVPVPPALLAAGLPADFARCIVVYFDGLGPGGAGIQSPANFNIGHPRGVPNVPWRFGDDVAAVERLLALLGRHLDAQLVRQIGGAAPALGPAHAVGFSNGGMFVYHLAARDDLSFDLVSICVCSGSIGCAARSDLAIQYEWPTLGLTPRRSVLHLHGALDTVVPPFGGTAGLVSLGPLPPFLTPQIQRQLEAQGIVDPAVQTLLLPFEATRFDAFQSWYDHNGMAAAGLPALPAVFQMPGRAAPLVITSTNGAQIVADALYPDLDHDWPTTGNAYAAWVIRYFFYRPLDFGP